MLPSRRAVITAFLFAWLFLPMASYRLPMIPDYSKMSATCLSVLLATFLFDLTRVTQFRLKLLDVPMLIFCLASLVTSITNGMGVYNGLSTLTVTMIKWGIPYFIGRLYFNDLQGLRELAIGIFFGGLIYVPFCLYEIRMSPQLHYIVYGYHQHSFGQTMRFGGYRPMVFMQHGLMVGTWMCTASLVGIWLRVSRVLVHVKGFPVSVLLGIVTITAIGIKSTGAVVLLLLGVSLLLVMRRFRYRWLLIGLAAIPILYVIFRGTGVWDGSELLELSNLIFGAERSGSLKARIANDTVLSEHARRSFFFGWGGWDRNRPAGMKTITDSMWIIIFGNRGAIGLFSLLGIILLPVLTLHRRIPVRLWFSQSGATVTVLAVVLALWMIDSLFNSMFNPIFLLIAGGLAGLKKTSDSGFLATEIFLKSLLSGKESAQSEDGILDVRPQD